ncbi:hypothetical protein HMEPL2_21690 [Vreelandella aquamarina]|uniref:Uncharacterized protein n=1 Tax=Vreelandella aquamarina TaxID=77097 RepID=A0A6F8XCI3_9GAMM|nr:hypothetical protein HMEPL2_21690 [Halomonas meridiana]
MHTPFKGASIWYGLAQSGIKHSVAHHITAEGVSIDQSPGALHLTHRDTATDEKRLTSDKSTMFVAEEAYCLGYILRLAHAF